MIIGEKNTNLKRLTRATKTSLFDRNWAISLKPRRRSRPLHLVWWALMLIQIKVLVWNRHKYVVMHQWVKKTSQEINGLHMRLE